MIKMSEFLLINSPIFWGSKTEDDDYLSPLGQGYIATQLDKAGIEVELLDSVKRTMSVEDILGYIKSTKPRYVGLNIFTQNYSIVKHIVENASFDGYVFIGGQAVKFMYDDILTWNCQNKCDIIIGEGEYIIPALCKRECQEQPIKVAGNKRVFRVTKDSKYFPADISREGLNRRFLHDELIINHYGEKEAAIITSRGCLYDCAFCGGARSLNGDVTPRIRDEASIVSELEEIVQIYPELSSIRILDDLFLRNPASFDLAIRVFRQFEGIHWRGMAHVLSLKGSIDKLCDLFDSGCRELFIGIEAGSPRVRKQINKLGTREDIVKVISHILEQGIDVKGYFIYGFPDETEADYYETFELAKDLKSISLKTKGNFRTSVFQFRPYHGTKLYNELIAKYGKIEKCEPNESISSAIGRSQFNFKSGNYSATTEDVMNQYITWTQNL